MEEKKSYKNIKTEDNIVSEPTATYPPIAPVAVKEKTYTHEEVFGNLRKRLKEFYGEK